MNLGNRHAQHSFAQIPRVNAPRSKFNRSKAVKDTMDFDKLTPLYCEEILPGDTLNLNVKSFCRLATQQVPVLDNMYMDFFFFFVPNRLVWDNWEKFNGAQDNPGDSVDFLIPQIKSPTAVDPAVPGFLVGSVYDHLGIPTEVPGIYVNALPFRAMNLIWNEWFRDQNLQQSLTVPKGDGPDDHTLYQLQYRAKKHDYFTSCLPWPQKGDAVTLPLGLEAPVYGKEVTADPTSGHTYQIYSGSPLKSRPTQALVGGMNPYTVETSPIGDASGDNFALGTKEQYDSSGGTPPYADLTEATAATINQFRQAIMMQSILELDARGGTRYTEILRAHFNVISPDFRLQRPEYLSGGTISINQHPVAQNSASVEGGTPQANLAAFSTAVNMGRSIGFTKSFVEHGYVIGFVQARADVTYQKGLNKMWSRRTRWDFFWPKFQELGEQAVLNGEIFAQGTDTDKEIFGYQERYAEYRYSPSEIRGQFRSNFDESLDVWHLAEDMENLPTLSGEFIQSSTPIERVLMVTEGYPALLCDYWFEQIHTRPMVTYGVPATLGRF